MAPKSENRGVRIRNKFQQVQQYVLVQMQTVRCISIQHTTKDVGKISYDDRHILECSANTASPVYWNAATNIQKWK